MTPGRVHTSKKLNSLRFGSHREAGSGSGPKTKSHQLVIVTSPTRPQLLEIPSYNVYRVEPDHSMVRNNFKKKLISICYPDLNLHQNGITSSSLHT